MRDATDDAVASILIQPGEIGLVEGWFRVKEAGDGSKTLSSGEQRPATDHVAADWKIKFKEWTDAGNVDTEISVCDGTTRLVVTLVQDGGGKQPVIFVPRHSGELCMVDARSIGIEVSGVPFDSACNTPTATGAIDRRKLQ